MKKFYFKTLLATLLLLCSTVVTAQTLNDWTSTNTAHGSTSSFTYYLDSNCKKITFDWSVSSEGGYDWLIVTIDGTEVLKKSGSAFGTYTHTFTTTNRHTLVVKYTKDSNNSSGKDQAKIYNIKYALGGKCGYNVTWLLFDGTLTIEGTGAMLDYSFDSEGWEYDAPWRGYSLKNAIIDNGITYIGNNIFTNCTSLTSITIPNSVTSIGSSAFKGCTGLTSITIPNSVTSIGYSAFNGCTRLTSITIPNSVTTIKSDAFYNTAWYNNQPDGVVYANKVLYNYKGTMPENTSITIKEGTLVIVEYAFSSCTGLTSITIPNSVTSIGDHAFYNCTNLKTVYNNSSLNITIGSYNHGHVAYYADIVVTSDDDIQNNFIFRTTDDKHILIGYTGSDSTITLPENFNNHIYTIGSYAFSGSSSLTSIIIPESVEEIAANAFNGCTSLTEIYSMAEVPAVIDETSFPNYSATLYVPAGAKRLYKITTGWSNFTNIVEMEPTEEPEEERLEGDVDGDGSVDIADITRLVEIILNGK